MSAVREQAERGERATGGRQRPAPAPLGAGVVRGARTGDRDRRHRPRHRQQAGSITRRFVWCRLSTIMTELRLHEQAAATTQSWSGRATTGWSAAFYLARSGLSTVALERRPFVGGCCVTEEFAPGFRASTGAYVLSMLREVIWRDMRLAERGLTVSSGRPGAELLPRRRAVPASEDLEETQARSGPVLEEGCPPVPRVRAAAGRHGGNHHAHVRLDAAHHRRQPHRDGDGGAHGPPRAGAGAATCST